MAWWNAVPLIGGWVEKGMASRARHRAADTRIADKSERLRRTLAASYEDWPKGPKTKDEFISWAHKFARGFATTDSAFEELIGIRPDASKQVSRSVRAARDEYHKAADIVSAAVKTTWQKLDQTADQRVEEASLRKAFAHLRQSVRELGSVSTVD